MHKCQGYIAIAIWIILSSLLLNSCSNRSSKDGPPDFYVDENAIPNPTPKVEPLAKYGNMKNYYVFGKRYSVMSSADNYEEVGTASWYGTKFHHRLTSSGERYNMLAMTAAHKSLPLPTYLEVTNLANNRKIIVKVNDRGPFSGDRLIDLSYVAAKKLGMLGHGTTMVRIKAINPRTYAGTPAAPVAPHTSPIQTAIEAPPVHSYPTYLYLQVGAFRNKANALHLRQQLSAFINTPVNIRSPSGTSQLYKVQVGPIKDSHTVELITSRLKMLGIKANKTTQTSAHTGL